MLKPDAQWHKQGQEIYGKLRQTKNHTEAITAIMVNCPDVVDWIQDAQYAWERDYKQA